MTSLSRTIAAALMTAPAFMPGLAEAQTESERYGYGPHMMWSDGGGYWMFFGPLFMILTLVAVIVAIALLVQWLGGSRLGSQPPHHLPPARTALDILKERFARGEIDKTEFEERRGVLGD